MKWKLLVFVRIRDKLFQLMSTINNIVFKVRALFAISTDLGDTCNLRCPIIFFARKWSVTNDILFELASAGICYLQSELHVKNTEQYNNYYWLNNSFNIYHCINIITFVLSHCRNSWPCAESASDDNAGRVVLRSSTG